MRYWMLWPTAALLAACAAPRDGDRAGDTAQDSATGMVAPDSTPLTSPDSARSPGTSPMPAVTGEPRAESMPNAHPESTSGRMPVVVPQPGAKPVPQPRDTVHFKPPERRPLRDPELRLRRVPPPDSTHPAP